LPFCPKDSQIIHFYDARYGSPFVSIYHIIVIIFLAAAQTNKCFKNYVDKIRPRFANRNEDALLTNPNDGKRWNEANLRKTLLTKYGCIVWPRFWPYVMRHWCATA